MYACVYVSLSVNDCPAGRGLHVCTCASVSLSVNVGEVVGMCLLVQDSEGNFCIFAVDDHHAGRNVCVCVCVRAEDNGADCDKSWT